MTLIFRLFLCALLAFQTAFAADPQPYQAAYRASLNKGLPVEGTAMRSLKALADGRWEIRSDVASFFADIHEIAHVSWRDGQVVAQDYDYQLLAPMMKDRRTTALFDWKAGKVTGVSKRGAYEYPTVPGLMDELSFQLQLAMDLQAGKTEVIYELVDDGKRRTNTFRVVGKESLQTGAGKVDTLIIEKIRDKDAERKTLFWIAPSWNYTLVRLLQNEPNGDSFEILLDKLTLGDKVIDP